MEVPKKGSKWKHYNGLVYEVEAITNQHSIRPEYPVTVVYRGANGNLWSRPLHDWYRSFQPFDKQ